MNFPIASLTDPDDIGPVKKRVCSAGNTSVTLSPESSCRECAMNATESLQRPKSLTEVNGRKRSSHWVSSMSSCHSSGKFRSCGMWMERRSNVERGGKDVLETCASD